MKFNIVLNFILVICLFALVSFCSNSEITVNTEYGPIVGICNEDNQFCRFLGYRYAQSTATDKRWTDPIAPEKWTEPQKCFDFGDICIQQYPWSTPVNQNRKSSEDCLFLNIWTPINVFNGNNEANLPVVFWIHGGAYVIGDSGDPVWYGTKFANSSNVVSVTINYRLGALGFLNTPDLNGNYGFKDQQLALKWVQNNIKTFGGDPKKVTLMGQSAGAMSTMLHMVAESSWDYYDQAIMSSNVGGLLYRTPEENIPYAEKFGKHLNCDYTNTTCLRAAPLDQIVKYDEAREWIISLPFGTKEVLAWEPNIDGTIITDQPLYMVQRGEFKKNVSVIIGMTKNETARFIPDVGVLFTEDLYKVLVEAFFATNSSKVLEQYPPLPRGKSWNQLIDLTTDYAFICPDSSIALSIANSGAPTYVYQFLQKPSDDPISGKKKACREVPCHSSDIPFYFNSQYYVPGATWTQDEEQLSLQMFTYFSKFINRTMSTENSWPKYTSATNSSIGFNSPQSTTFTNYRKSFCDFWQNEMGGFIY